MNLVLFDQHELAGKQLVLNDFRAKHIRSILGLSPGDSLRIGMINGRLGRGKIVSMAGAEVEIAVELDREPPPPPEVELILALPRPIMLQRILKQATTLGVYRFHLIRSAKVEKSFFQSPALNPEKIRERLLEGLSQSAVDTCLPEVSIHHRFKPFVEDTLPTLTGQGLIAHPDVPGSLLDAFPSLQNKKILLAVGPEGGWNDFEVHSFMDQGFTPFSLGSRILHVDTAVVTLLAQLQMRKYHLSTTQ
ncbi:MAG: 16S rRNA (uracil(1498)-N(3))-methyltransferase [Candidatus Electrothrix sp. AR3]|nr:16S rRNA (uracil(1498)-N(3))-methyltransferase [Candidatus Electrothrix sp. AR3]